MATLSAVPFSALPTSDDGYTLLNDNGIVHRSSKKLSELVGDKTNSFLTKEEGDSLYQEKGDYLIDDDITGKLDKSQYAVDSATFLTAHQDISNKLDTTAFSTVSSNFLTAHQSLDEYSTKEYANNASANALSQAETWVENQHYLSAIPDTYALKTDIPTTVAQLTDSGNYYKKTETSSKNELDTAFGSKQDNLTKEQLSAISSVSSIKGTVLVGDSNIRATSAEDGNNIKWTLELTAKPVVTDTTLSGYDGIVATKDSTVSSQWNVGIAQAYKEQIESVSSKLTQDVANTLYAPISVTEDVETLKSASAGWNEVSAIYRIDSIESNLANKKDKQTELNFNGSATKTVKTIKQNANGEMHVEFEDINLPPEVPNVEITSEDNSVQVTETTDVQTNTKTFDLSVTESVKSKIKDIKISSDTLVIIGD